MKFTIIILISAVTALGCGNKSQTYYIPMSYISEAFSNVEKYNTPYQVSRRSVNENIYISVENMGVDFYRDSTQRRNIENGSPTIGIYLYDSASIKIVVDSGSYRAVAPLLQDEAPMTRNAKLNIQSIPDGLYYLVINDVNSEFPLEIKIVVTTL
jgi:hypothetical protein